MCFTRASEHLISNGTHDAQNIREFLSCRPRLSLRARRAKDLSLKCEWRSGLQQRLDEARGCCIIRRVE